MTKRKNYYTILVIFILAFLAGSLSYPKFFNKGIDFLNSWLKLDAPHLDAPFKLGLDLQGGVHLLYQADLSSISQKDYSSAMAGLRDVIERRVNLFGVSEPVVQVERDRLIVELAGISDPAEAISQIGKTPFLEFKEPKENYEEIIKQNQKLAESGGTNLEEPFKTTSLTGKYLKRAETTRDQTTYKPVISLQFSDEGAKIFEELTKKNIGKPVAIYIDNILISAPTVEEAISGGKAQITGSFTVKEAQEVARNLNAGALPLPISIISQESVGPTLGRVSLEKSLKAGIIGFLIVVLFMIIFYRLPGFLASVSLVIYVALVLALFKLISVTLSLAGIAGFILSIGMAVDANILIFARIREELKERENFAIALEEGFRRAWSSIRDSNLTTLLVGIILFGFGTSFIKGFALTLSLGIIISMFSAIFITKNFLRLFAGTKLEKIKSLW